MQIVAILAMLLMSIIGLIAMTFIRNQQHTIDRQQDTIQRLINREPVTYQEVGKKPEKVIEEVYSAWGNVTVDREVTQE